MEFGQMGYPFYTLQNVDYFSTQTLNEFDALVIDTVAILDYRETVTRASIAKRNQDLIDFLNIKKLPIVYTSPSQIDSNSIVMNGKYTVAESIEKFFPINKLETQEESGNKLDIVNNTPFTDFLQKFEKFFGYNRIYEKYTGRIIASTPHTKKVISFYNNEFVFLPLIKNLNKEVEEAFFNDLFICLKRIREENQEPDLPAWSKTFLLPGEKDISEDISSITNQIRELNSKLEKYRNRIGELIEKKRMFTGQGNELEKKVEDALRILGFEILETEQNRDDLIVKFGKKIAVIEIKGLGKSAGDKHAAQLEKWVTDYFLLTGVEPKGILIVNAYRETPLDQRIEPSFPNQMLRYAKSKQLCLITSLQLLCLSYEVETHPEKREEIINSLFDTVGIYPDTYKWQDYISKQM